MNDSYTSRSYKDQRMQSEYYNNTCADYHTCDDCLNASVWCHFCHFDYKCHAIGSPMGCLKGISACHHLQDCERNEPQFVGYGPPTSVVLTVFGIMAIMACCICAFMTFYKRLPRSVPRQRADFDVKSNDRRMNDDESNQGDQSEPLLAAPHLATLDSLHNSRPASQVDWGSVFKRMIWFSALIVLTSLTLMFYPRIPTYNVCNREFQWESILHSIVNFQPEVEYQVLLSIINENRFGFELEYGKADIYYNNDRVGNWVLNKTWTAAAGSISDVIIPVHIEPGYAQGLSMLSDFQQNKLLFVIDVSVSGSIKYGAYKIYHVTSKVPSITFIVNAAEDRSLCKCTEYLTPQ